MTQIVIAAHGTRSAPGVEGLRSVVTRIQQVSDLEVQIGWIDLLEPTLDQVLSQTHEAVVVPWLVGGGYHLVVDVHAVAAAHPYARVTEPLGESPALIQALGDRLRAIDHGTAPVALTWAGSTVEEARQRVTRIARQVSVATGRAVEPVAMTACDESPQDAIARLRARYGQQPTVLCLLLAPGHFHSQATQLSGRVSQPLGSHPSLVRWVSEQVLNPAAGPEPEPTRSAPARRSL